MAAEITLAADHGQMQNRAREIENNLLSSLSTTNVQSRNERIVLSIAQTKGEIAGGLVASTSYGWLLIKALWVHERLRGKGYGRELVGRAEEEGRLLGCHGAWLDTSNPSAYTFYLKLGYSVFGSLENARDQYPPDHQRWFMKKPLSSDGGASSPLPPKLQAGEERSG